MSIEVGEPYEVGPAPGEPVTWPTGPPGPPGPPGGAGNITTGVAAVNLGGHRVVTPLADATFAYASNDDLSNLAAPLWITTGAAVQGEVAEAVMTGPMTEPSWSFAPGPVYLGTDGALTQVLPVAPAALFLAQVGYATSPTSLVVDRYPSIKIT